MEFFRVYRRVIGLLRAERGLAIMLALANVAVAALQFYEPVLFGKVVDLLSSARDKPVDVLWSDARDLLMLWAAVGLGGIVANIVVSLQADRMAHRRRLGAMATFFEHVLVLPFAFHHGQHSGRLLKVMLTGVDHLFGIWLSFFRENLATFVALFIMLPLSLFMNWRLGLLLIVLILFFAIANAWVVGRTDRLQQQVEDRHSELASRAGDALGNIHLIQSFVRLGAEAGEMHRIIRETLAAQYPVLNWWALLSVLTRAASTITVILIFVLGTWLYTQGEASVGEIVSFMGFATMLIGRMDQASGFVSRIFFQMPALADFFRVLDSQSTVPDNPHGKDIGRAKGDVEFDDINFSYDGKRPALVHFSLKVPAGTTVAFVGPTGAGKSTALSLLHRMWDAQSGVIRIDGIDHRDIKLESLRRNIGVVFQDSTMFYRSIADNLRIGKPDATPGRARGGGQARRGARLHHAPAQRLRHHGGRARRHAVGRRAPAAGDRPRAAQEPADPDPRRGDQRARFGDRGAHPEGAQDADAGPHHLHHRPSPVDHPRRRPGRGVRARPGGRAGQLPGARRRRAAPSPASSPPSRLA